MTTAENQKRVAGYFAALSGQPKPETLVRHYTNDPALLGHIAFFDAAFPQYDLFVDDMIAEADKVTARARFHGVHQGTLQGIAPTGKTVALPFLFIYRIAEGMITEHWMAVGQLDLMKQLGVIPQ